MSDTDRRRDPRFEPDRTIAVKIRGARRGSAVQSALVSDLSARGLRLQLREGHGLRVGDQVRVFFAPSGENLSAGIQGECVEAEVVGGPDTVTVHLRADELATLSDPDYAAYLEALSDIAA